MIMARVDALLAAGESMEVEFKGESRAALNDRELIEAVVCLANRTGPGPAWLLVGVEDNGQVTGARPRHEGGRTDARHLQALIGSRTQPSLSCAVEMVITRDRKLSSSRCRARALRYPRAREFIYDAL